MLIIILMIRNQGVQFGKKIMFHVRIGIFIHRQPRRRMRTMDQADSTLQILRNRAVDLRCNVDQFILFSGGNGQLHKQSSPVFTFLYVLFNGKSKKYPHGMMSMRVFPVLFPSVISSCPQSLPARRQYVRSEHGTDCMKHNSVRRHGRTPRISVRRPVHRRCPLSGSYGWSVRHLRHT